MTPYANTLAESIYRFYKAEVIRRQSWKTQAKVERATLTWGDWYNNCWRLERRGHIASTEVEQAYYASIGNKDLAA